MLLCAPMGFAQSAPAHCRVSRSLLVASGPMKHGAMASRLTPISFSRSTPSCTDGALSVDAVMTGSASRAASSTEVTLAAAAASGPPTVAMSTPSAAVTMLNSRTRSARARPDSASRMCSTSAIIALELMKPLMMAFVPLAATAARNR